MDGWNTTFLLGKPIFRGENVSFREGSDLLKSSGIQTFHFHSQRSMDAIFVSSRLSSDGKKPEFSGRDALKEVAQRSHPRQGTGDE